MVTWAKRGTQLNQYNWGSRTSNKTVRPSTITNISLKHSRLRMFASTVVIILTVIIYSNKIASRLYEKV